MTGTCVLLITGSYMMESQISLQVERRWEAHFFIGRLAWGEMLVLSASAGVLPHLLATLGVDPLCLLAAHFHRVSYPGYA